ncbi:ParA family protein [Streptomyces sp. ISL-43]|uniref:ParA family protein n=1 Tax=Streptomyces sp. ISL-43 TaxID=2819183 RepID=UPI001BE9A307|nr:ParA family protein [Streptomyces sp. ISL-43]MBT2452734.1 ParA family protein [Streptomyces sp. ISL-43]
MISIALFNNKGGVGKTTLAYHLAHMLQRQGSRVLAVDLDPQSNLTAAILDEDELEQLWGKDSELFAQNGYPEQRKLFTRTESQRTIADAVRPILEGTGDIQPVSPVTVTEGLWLLPGNLELSKFEDKLSAAWLQGYGGDQAAIRTTTAFHRIIEQAAAEVDADLVLIDVGPNLGAINRAALLAADTVLTPMAADLFSLKGLLNLGPTLRDWRRQWQNLVQPHIPATISSPVAAMEPLGYVIMQPEMRLDRPVRAYERWLARMPWVYGTAVLGHVAWPDDDRSYEIATLRNYRSLMPLAHDARKPMFDLRAADGALGSTQKYVQTCYQEFRSLAEKVQDRAEAVLDRKTMD